MPKWNNNASLSPYVYTLWVERRYRSCLSSRCLIWCWCMSCMSDVKSCCCCWTCCRDNAYCSLVWHPSVSVHSTVCSPISARICTTRANKLIGQTVKQSTNIDDAVTVIFTIIRYSITHSLFHSRLKTFLFCKSFPPQPSLFLLRDSLHGFPRLFTVIYEHICFLLFSFFCSTLFSCRFRVVD